MSGVSDHLRSIAFDIFVKWAMSSQELNFKIKGCWFGCEEFDIFERSLSQLMTKDNGSATLFDLSHNPIIFLKTDDVVLMIEIFFLDALDKGCFKLSAKSHSIELSEIRDKLALFDKCW
ncbi:hypothetical protein [Shewanella surugensis]|uniref:Uncharacterized protein n=1 Tax=Shewanella surugensis TaxID=212020 RepID=A0ABT0LER6_9GAMM|nr:hypothetical protein [Shewanella surugensis]MCL1126202.1 hypothetical protein [Shewanella surugensis]